MSRCKKNSVDTPFDIEAQRRKEVCKLVRAWLLTSYCILGKEICPLLSQLRVLKNLSGKNEEQRLFNAMFGPHISSLDDLATTFAAVMGLYEEMFIDTLLPDDKRVQYKLEGESDG